MAKSKQSASVVHNCCIASVLNSGAGVGVGRASICSESKNAGGVGHGHDPCTLQAFSTHPSAQIHNEYAQIKGNILQSPLEKHGALLPLHVPRQLPGLQMSGAVGLGVGGVGVGAGVGLRVGGGVGGAKVGNGVGWNVGNGAIVGFGVGSIVGFFVGSLVGSPVGSALEHVPSV